jgi:hypothetical protein
MQEHCKDARQILAMMQPLIAKCAGSSDTTTVIKSLTEEYVCKDNDITG